MRSEEGLIEPYFVQDIYADGIGEIEVLGDNIFRAIYFTYAKAPGSQIYDRVVCAKLVRPITSVLSPHGEMARWIKERQKGRQLALHAHHSTAFSCGSASIGM